MRASDLPPPPPPPPIVSPDIAATHEPVGFSPDPDPDFYDYNNHNHNNNNNNNSSNCHFATMEGSMMEAPASSMNFDYRTSRDHFMMDGTDDSDYSSSGIHNNNTIHNNNIHNNNNHHHNEQFAMPNIVSNSTVNVATKRRRVARNGNDSTIAADDTDDDFSSLDDSLMLADRASPPATPYSGDDEDDIDTLPLSVDGPIPHPSYDLTESMIAQKMSSLSMKEREKVYFDIHGVADVIDETAQVGFLDRKLDEMEMELKQIIITMKEEDQQRQAYDMALAANPSYVNDRNFRLRFLRAERFDAKLAAGRYVRHYATKLDLFGPDKLARDIVQDDLEEEALDALYSGVSQFLPRRDNAGRIVLLWVPGSKTARYSRDALRRRMFYVAMMVSEDIDTQRKGVVVVFYALNQQQVHRGSQGSGILRGLTGMVSSLPMVVVGIHFCYDSYTWIPALSVVQVSCNLFMQLRFRTYFGSHADCLYKLQTFGIPADTLPVDDNGNLDVDHHQRFLEKRREEERRRANEDTASVASSSSKNNNNSSSGAKKKKNTTNNNNNNNNNTKRPTVQISVPASSDILLGRGKGYFNHVGNVRYRSIIEEHKNRYDRATKEERQGIAEGIVDMVYDYGGRFLKDDGGVWIQIDDKTARHKVGHSFRALRSASKKNNNTNNNPKDGQQQQQHTATTAAATAPAMKRIMRD